MKDLADRVGVSRQLVSLVLRDLPGASEETRSRVREAATELGYFPDSSARLLRGRRSYQVGVVFTMRQPFEVDLVESLFTAAKDAGFALVLGPLTPERSQSAVVRELLEHRIEALLVLAADGGSATMADLPERLPVIQIGGPVSTGRSDDIRVDSRAGIRELMEHLTRLGHRRITHVTGGSGPNAADRRSAYEEFMRELGLESEMDVVEGAYTEVAGAAAAELLLTRPHLPTAIVAGNDRSAVGILETLVRHDVVVPRDLSIVGFDDSSIARLPFVQLTTMGHDPRSLARRAIEVLVRRLDDPARPPQTDLEIPELIVRSSTAPPRASPNAQTK